MPTTIRLEPELEARYRELAQHTGRSQTFYIRQALEDAIDRLEWEYSILKDVEDIKAGRLKTMSSEEVEAYFEMEN